MQLCLALAGVALPSDLPGPINSRALTHIGTVTHDTPSAVAMFASISLLWDIGGTVFL